MKIYISGKMRGLPEEESRMKFEAARQYLFDQGHDAVNPWDSEKKKEEQCSEWSEYILYDLQIIKNCDALFMLNNWQDSNGAKCEHAFAKGMGMDIFYEPQEPDGESLEAEFDRYIKKIAPTSIISGTIDLRDMAHHFANWQKQQMMKNIIAEQDCTCIRVLHRIVGGSWNLSCPLDKLNLGSGDKVKLIIIKKD